MDEVQRKRTREGRSECTQRYFPPSIKEVRTWVPVQVRDWLKIRAQRNGSSIRAQAAKLLEQAMLKELYKEGRITDRRSGRRSEAA